MIYAYSGENIGYVWDRTPQVFYLAHIIGKAKIDGVTLTASSKTDDPRHDPQYFSLFSIRCSLTGVVFSNLKNGQRKYSL